MKLLVAYVRKYLANEIVSALKDLNTPRFSALEIKTLGDEIMPNEIKISADLNSTYTTMVKIELVCADECIERIKKTIMKDARTGHKGDGLIVIMPVNEAISIRTGKEERFLLEEWS